MRMQVNFIENEKIGNLQNLFKISQGPLYHYTNSLEASTNIVTNNEIYLTRADHFLDKKEICYGIKVLSDTSEKILTENELKSFQAILDALSNRFKQCFVFCFTQTRCSTKHIDIHGENILEFNENFPTVLANMSKHCIPNGVGFSLFYSNDLYKVIEGFVEYDIYVQKSIAAEICMVFKETINSDIHIVDQIHYIDVIIKFILLIKESSYSWEKEYRVGLLSNSKWSPLFENTNENGKVFIKLFTQTVINKIGTIQPYV